MVTPKEKAQELIERFNPMTYTAVHAHKTPYEHQDAIKCAKIAVDYIIDSCEKTLKLYHDNDMINSDIDYQPIEWWQEVKKELENYEK